MRHSDLAISRLRAAFTASDGVFAGAVIVVYGTLLWSYNLVTGTIPDSASYFVSVGQAECLSRAPFTTGLRCDLNGEPAGLIVAFGLPQLWLTAVANWALPLSLEVAFRLVWAGFLALALVGAVLMFRLLAESRWLGLFGAGVFLSLPIVAAQGSYGALQLGFALMPAYVVVHWQFLLGLRQRRRGTGVWGAGVVVVHILALFTDGYSAVMMIVVTALLVLIWAVGGFRRGTLTARVASVAAAVYAAGVASAYVLYSGYVGLAGYPPMPTDFFRGQGIDLAFRVIPSDELWLARLSGLHHDITPYQAFSDGPNTTHVYIGIGLVIGAALAVAVVKRRPQPIHLLLGAVAAAGVVGLVLGLGPSLKVNDLRSAADSPAIPAFADYLMTSEEASAPTGLAWLYQHVPGISAMRALVRWDLLVQLALVSLTVVGLGALARGRRWVSLAAVVILVLAGTLRDLPSVHQAGVNNNRIVKGVEGDVVVPLREVTQPGERILMGNAAPGRKSSNHYLANWICPRASIVCFNSGGDKAQEKATAAQPPGIVAALRDTTALGELVAGLAGNPHVDAVLLVYFDLRANAYFWPPSPTERDRAARAAAAMSDSPGLSVTPLPWGLLVRAADRGPRVRG